MPELLLELLSEEIPARMQAKAAEDLRGLVTNGLVEAGLTYEGAQAHAGPRRLVLSVEGLNAKAADTAEERKGPRVDAPQAAIDGFLKSTGLKLEDLKIQDDKKGRSYIAVIRKQGRAATEIIAGLVPEAIGKFPWPKSMRWGSGTLRWVRPLQSILCTFDGEIVPFAVGDLASGNTTRGHRFMGAQKIEARRFEDYAASLDKNFVIVDAKARAEIIRAEARNLAFAQGLEMIEDEGLLKEAAGLVEWPVVLMGEFDESFLSVPPEVIVTSIKNHQKCFALRRPSRLAALAPQDEGKGESAQPSLFPHAEEPAPSRASKGQLSNKYLMVSNMIASDGGKTIIAGNNKVIAARLSDAKFFWDQDRKVKLADWLPKLDSITFHAKLGSQGERVKRIEVLAGEIAEVIGADVKKTFVAARFAKADLVTAMVGEFPELQGLMGHYYALDQKIDEEVAEAIRDHYKPLGPSDSLPKTLVGLAVAIAEKLDLLIGFWAMDEKPTGSKDPYALRRAALGIIRIILGNSLRIRLSRELYGVNLALQVMGYEAASSGLIEKVKALYGAIHVTNYSDETLKLIRSRELGPAWKQMEASIPDRIANIESDLLAFFVDRLKVYLRDHGARHDLIDAVMSLGNQDDLLMIVRRVEALSKFLDTDDGKNLLAGVKRAANILKIEEKKDERSYDGDIRIDHLIKGEEKALHTAITVATGQTRKAVEAEDFEGAMRAIAKLRGPVDAFFDKVTVNDKDATFRENRLKLLNRIRNVTLEVADFSKIEG